MVLKQIAVTQDENDILFDLVHHELRHGQVFGTNPDVIPALRVLLGLYDQLDKFDPPKRVKELEKSKETNKKFNDKKARRSSKGDL